MAHIFYSLQQYTPSECEVGPYTSKRQTKVDKDGGSCLRRPQKECLWTEDPCQVQVQVQVHANLERSQPPEALTKDSGCGRRGTLE